MPVARFTGSHRFERISRFLQSGWLEFAITALAAGIGMANMPESVLSWSAMIVLCVGAAISGVMLLPGAALVCAGLVISLGLPFDDVSAAGLALFVPILAAVRRTSRFTVPITLVLSVLGFCTMVLHASGDRPLTAANLVIFPVLFAMSVGAGLIMRASHKQLETERQQAADQLAELRLDLARELHDNAVHKISQAAMRAHMGALRPETPADLANEFTQIATSCNDAAHELRLLLTGLRQDSPAMDSGQPQIIDADALTALIEGQADRLAALGFAITQDVKTEAPTSLQCRTLAAITIEAVNNIVQHAPARSECSIRVDQQAGTLMAEFTNQIRDLRRATSRPSFGLLGIEERARAAGGFITISKPSGRWRLMITLPPVPGFAAPEAVDSGAADGLPTEYGI